MVGEKDGFLKDEKLIIYTLLKHEEKLQLVESELERLRHEIDELESLKEKITYWINLCDKLRKVEKWSNKNLEENF